MPTEQRNGTNETTVHATTEHNTQPPDWFASFALVSLWFRSSWALLSLAPLLKGARRVDATCGIDIFFVLLAALCSNQPLLHAHRQLQALQHLLPPLWFRRSLASRFAVSRALSLLDEPMMLAVQSLFCTLFASMDDKTYNTSA